MSGRAAYQGNMALPQEAPDSPLYEFAERITCTRTFGGKYDTLALYTVRVGDRGTGDMFGYLVAQCNLQRVKPDLARLIIRYEATQQTVFGESLPPDSFTIEAVDQQPAVETHWKFKNLTRAQIELCHVAVESDDDKVRSDAYAKLEEILPLPVRNAALALYELLNKGVTSFYQPLTRYSYSYSTYTLPPLHPGGCRKKTLTGAGTEAIPTGLRWLREADTCAAQGVNGGIYRITQSWLGAPDGHWSHKLYPRCT